MNQKPVKTKNPFEKIRWWILTAIAIIIFGYIFNQLACIPQGTSLQEVVGLEKEIPLASDLKGKEFGPREKVVVTYSDNKIHRPGCTEIKGATEKMLFSTALDRRYTACPVCIGDH